MGVVSFERLRDDIAGLPGVRDFVLGVARTLRRTVPFDGVCVLTMDPATLVPTGEVVEHGLPESAYAQMAEMEAPRRGFQRLPHARHRWPPGGDAQRGDRRRARGTAFFQQREPLLSTNHAHAQMSGMDGRGPASHPEA